MVEFCPVGGGAVAQSQSELTRQQLFVCQREAPRDSSLFKFINPHQTPPRDSPLCACVRAVWSASAWTMRFHRVSSRQQPVFLVGNHRPDPFDEEARRGRGRNLFFLMMSTPARARARAHTYIYQCLLGLSATRRW